MPIQINSPGWTIRRGVSRGGAQRGDSNALAGLPPEFLTDDSRIGQEETLDPPSPTRGAAVASAGLDLSYSAPPDRTAILAIRHPSGALTFHRPVQSTTRGARGPSEVRFQVTLPRRATRGLVGDAIKAIVIEVAKVAADRAVSFLLPKLAETAERALWKKKGLKEGWLRVTKETLASGALTAGTPVSPLRSLLFIHGTFSNAASAYHDLAESTFFDRVKEIYGDRIFAFDHFTISRTPEQNATMLLDALPDHATTFDVVTHSRGGLVLRNLVERAKQLGGLASRFKLGSAVLVASPNEGTPLATPRRWDETVGWMANLLELFPDNPFTTGAAFVANGVVWLANHASGDLPGLHSMDADGDLIEAIQGPPGPPAAAYSALVANYQPTGSILARLVDVGFDQFFASANDLVVPTEGGWRVDRTTTDFIPAARIGCFGPGGNLKQDSVTHVSFFSHSETVDFLVNALLARQQPLDRVDPRKPLPDRRLIRGGISDAPVSRRPARAALKGEKRVAAAGPRSAAALRITVTNGDLTFEREALLLGHYRSTRLTGTEGVMNKMLGGAMAHSLQVGVYPVTPGSNKIFINNRPAVEQGILLPRPKAVIVVGLGEEGKLQAADLVLTVRQAVIEWAQRLVEHKTHGPALFELATTLIGSGGPGITAGESARLIAQGVYEANALLADEQTRDARWPRVGHLHVIELYLDRATEAWRALRMQEAATEGRYAVADEVKPGTGSMLRPPDTGYRGADYDFITVETVTKPGAEPELSFTLDTRRARSEVRAQRTQSKLLQDLVTTASNDRNRDRQIGRTLFNLLIPIELEAFMAGSGEMQVELDSGSAPIPWEVLDTDIDGAANAEPWAIRVKLLRKLRTPTFRANVRDADADEDVLVIGEPECPEEYPRLSGARNEAIAVRTCLTGPGALEPDRVTGLISDDPSEFGADAQTIVNTLFEKPWRIVHIAGHGTPPKDGSLGGVVLSNGNFLGASEIEKMRVVPELVFVNCCYLASGASGKLLQYDRASFASGVAEALITIGVRCVVAAGWAVDDDAANVFAETFYESLLRRNRFIDAVADARRAAYERSPDVNTWAAYQCYGDPDWVFRRSAPDANQATAPAAEDFSGVASATGLRLALERIIVQAKFQGFDLGRQLTSVRQLEKMFGEKWGKRGAVAELFGEALVQVDAVESGMHWYERAVTAPDGLASMKAAEQLANVRSRLGWELVDHARRQLDDAQTGENAAGRGKARANARRARVEAERSLRTAVARADDLIDQSLELLAKLLAMEETMERHSLVGSAYKRRALVDTAAGRQGRVQKDLRDMKAHYETARRVGAASGETDQFYPASNCVAADVALNAGTRRWKGLDVKMLAIVEESLEAKSGRDADFWSAIGKIELIQYQALADGELASQADKIDKACKDLHNRVTAARKWASVYDTACLVLPNYAARAKGKEKKAATELLEKLRVFAHPGDSDNPA